MSIAMSFLGSEFTWTAVHVPPVYQSGKGGFKYRSFLLDLVANNDHACHRILICPGKVQANLKPSP